MTQKVEAQRKMNVSAAAVWKTVSAVENMEAWYPGLIASSTVDRTGDVVTRQCQMANGGELDERILANDQKTRTFVYAIDRHPLPVRDIVGMFRIDGDDTGALVTWSAQFDVDAEQADAMIEMITGMYAAGLESLENYQIAKR